MTRLTGTPLGPATQAGPARLAVAAVILLLLSLWLAVPAVAASAGDQQCLTCHGLPGLQKTPANGEVLSLHIDAQHFVGSVHAALGCTGCHSNISLANHPPAANVIASKRAFSIAMIQQTCRNCHATEFDQWSHSVHAALVREGNPAAPVCTNCHSPHTMIKGAAQSLATVPCKTCHAVIFNAYLTSVHGMLRTQGLTAAPLCFNCHGAHDIAVPSAGVGRRDACLACHTEAAASHRTWLPNVDLHFAAVSCPVCHTPQAHRVVDLILYNSTTQQELSRPLGIPEFETRGAPATAQKPGLDPTTLVALLTALNGRDVKEKTSVRGRLEVSTGVEDHELAVAAKAISDCGVCHRKGAAAFQSVEVSVAGPGGIPINYGASSAVLTSVFSIPSVGGFYAIGGTRIGFLDVAFLLALVGAIGWSCVHMAVRWGVHRYTHGAGGGEGKDPP
ncbi:MAG TPA: hypothetical protein VGG99_11590 [Acetobacteraceae bacterium]